MHLSVNGDAIELAGRTISDLLDHLQLHGRRLAVEVNEEIVPKSAHNDFQLNDGDRIEIVHAIGGG